MKIASAVSELKKEIKIEFLTPSLFSGGGSWGIENIRFLVLDVDRHYD